MSIYLNIELPYPNRILFPNGRAHWRARAKSAKAYRAAGFFYASQAIGGALSPRFRRKGRSAFGSRSIRRITVSVTRTISWRP